MREIKSDVVALCGEKERGRRCLIVDTECLTFPSVNLRSRRWKVQAWRGVTLERSCLCLLEPSCLKKINLLQTQPQHLLSYKIFTPTLTSINQESAIMADNQDELISQFVEVTGASPADVRSSFSPRPSAIFIFLIHFLGSAVPRGKRVGHWWSYY